MMPNPDQNSDWHMPLGYSSIVGQSQADYQGYEIYAGNEGFKIPHRHLYSSVHLL